MMRAFDWDIVDVDPGISVDDARRALGVDPTDETGRFPGRAEAEEYLGENWRRLAASGVRSVRLTTGGEVGAVVLLEAGE